MVSFPYFRGFFFLCLNHRFFSHAAFAFVPEIPMLSGELPLPFFDPAILCPVFLLFLYHRYLMPPLFPRVCFGGVDLVLDESARE